MSIIQQSQTLGQRIDRVLADQRKINATLAFQPWPSELTTTTTCAADLNEWRPGQSQVNTEDFE